MTPKQFFNSNTKERVTAVAKAAGTTFANFQQIALYGGSCSSRLARRLEISSGEDMKVTEILYPEDHDSQSKTTAA